VTATALGGSERALPISGDLADGGIETCLVAAAVARYGRLDGALITVAGSAPGTVMDTEDGAWRLGFESMFLGPLRLARAVGSSVSHEGGSIVLVLSTSVREPIEQLALSNGLRPGLAMTAKTLADELGPENVRVNAVLPGRIESERARRDVAHHDDVGMGGDADIPLRRHGEPLEFARPAVFLLSPAASYVTGTVLAVDGGLTRSL
jgi:3-oxoacyl-[acyl-carrier protein] reductase